MSAAQQRLVCVACARDVAEVSRSGRCPDCRYINVAKALQAGAIVHPTTPYADDPACQMLVSAHPGGLTLEEIGEAMGMSIGNVRLIEARALKNLRARLVLVGITADMLLPGAPAPAAEDVREAHGESYLPDGEV